METCFLRTVSLVVMKSVSIADFAVIAAGFTPQARRKRFLPNGTKEPPFRPELGEEGSTMSAEHYIEILGTITILLGFSLMIFCSVALERRARKRRCLTVPILSTGQGEEKRGASPQT